MASQKYANLAQSTLASGYTAGDSTLALQTGDGSLFPSSGDFIVALDDPPTFFLKCNSRSTDTLTVTTSGQEGTTAVNKSSGTKVTQVITKGALDNIRSDISLIDVYASLPGSGMVKGDRFRATDAPYEFVYDGTNWKAFHGGYPVTVPPSSSWSWDNQGGSSVVSSNGSLNLIFAKTGATNGRMYYRTAPSTPYTIVILLDVDLPGAVAANSPSFAEGVVGPGFRDGSSGKIMTWHNGCSSGQSASDIAKWTSTTSFSAVQDGMSPTGITTLHNLSFARRIWYRIGDDGTNIKWEYSLDGFTWQTRYSVARGTFFASPPNQVGIFCYTNGTGPNVNVLSWG
jgi:hypothetical protein